MLPRLGWSCSWWSPPWARAAATEGKREPSSPPKAAPAERPTKVPAAPGEVTLGYAATVIDAGSGAELCLGGVDESLPPQCDGPPLVGWDWADHDGDFEESDPGSAGATSP